VNWATFARSFRSASAWAFTMMARATIMRGGVDLCFDAQGAELLGVRLGRGENDGAKSIVCAGAAGCTGRSTRALMLFQKRTAHAV